MIDIDKQVAYWRDGATEDWIVAQELVELKRIRHALFMAHLALEKILKAHVCRYSGNLAPRIHNLARLAELSGLSLNETQLQLLAEMNAFQIAGRYPESLSLTPTIERAKLYMQRAREVFEWLNSQLQTSFDNT